MPQPTEYHNFLTEVLETTAKSQGDKNRMYPLLEANQDKLDEVLQQILQAWGTETLGKSERKQANYLARVIGEFSNLIREFPLGSRAQNLEIAITGYEVVLSVWTREDFPVEWAQTQNNLGTAYSDRLQGDKAGNRELAISCYQQALLILTKRIFL